MKAKTPTGVPLDESVVGVPHYHISPKDIFNSGSLRSLEQSFGNKEAALSASRLMHLFVKIGYWSHFLLEELELVYKGRVWPTMDPFRGLDTYVIEKDGLYYVTDLFVDRCANVRPHR
jgi:hypothetical protein